MSWTSKVVIWIKITHSRLNKKYNQFVYTWTITSKRIQPLTHSDSKAWSRWSTNKTFSSISGREGRSFLNLSPDKMSATTGQLRCLAKISAAHISSSVWIAPRSKSPLSVPLIISRTSAIGTQAPSLHAREFCNWIYLVNGSAPDIQISNPFKQLNIQLSELSSRGSLKGQLIWTGPYGKEVAQCTAESIVVSTIRAGILSVGAGRLKVNLTKEPKWFTWHTFQPCGAWVFQPKKKTICCELQIWIKFIIVYLINCLVCPSIKKLRRTICGQQ